MRLGMKERKNDPFKTEHSSEGVSPGISLDLQTSASREGAGFAAQGRNARLRSLHREGPSRDRGGRCSIICLTGRLKGTNQQVQKAQNQGPKERTCQMSKLQAGSKSA